VQENRSSQIVTAEPNLTQEILKGSFRRPTAYSGSVTTTESDSDFAEAAGLRIEQAFVLCSFAADLVGKARQ